MNKQTEQREIQNSFYYWTFNYSACQEFASVLFWQSFLEQMEVWDICVLQFYYSNIYYVFVYLNLL